MYDDQTTVTELLARWQDGDERAAEQLFPLIHGELRRRARRFLRRETPGHTLETDALVNEAFVRLVGEHSSWQNRAHFFAIAARSMRRILVDHARTRGRVKHGGGRSLVTLDPELVSTEDDPGAFLDLDRALVRLAQSEPELAHLVELRYFSGLELKEIAWVQGISVSKVKRDVRFALALLHDELKGSGGGE